MKPTPLEFLQAVYSNPEVPLHTRIKAAVEALSFVHPKLSMTAYVDGGDFAATVGLEKAITRSREMKVISPPKPKAKVDLEDLNL